MGEPFHLIVARNPATVCCPEALLACALETVGVPPHPRFAFAIETEEIGGAPQTGWRWLFGPASACGSYQTADLVKWWHDEDWLAAHPHHEWAILRRSLCNLAEVARRVRATVPRVIVRRGLTAAHIPANASPARRAHLLGQLEGTVPLSQSFTEPAATPHHA